MKLYGLTGNMGCGKSTVAKFLAAKSDVIVFDCDKIAKEVIARDAIRQDVSEIAGAEIFMDGGMVDWKKLAAIVFSDKQKKLCLENLVHPLVREHIACAAERFSQNTIGIVESAIIYETNWHAAFDGIIVVVCDEKEQVRRLQNLRSMSGKDIRARLNAQLPQREKEQRADFIISTKRSLEELEQKVNELYLKLRQHNQ